MVNFAASFVVGNLIFRFLTHAGGECLDRQTDLEVSRFWRAQALDAPRCSYRRINCYRQALERDPAFHQAYLELAEVYYELGITYGYRDIFREAASNLEKALQLDAADPEVHHRLGQVYFLMRDFAGARRELEAARLLREGNPSP